jgi:hypothetical protein
MRGNLDSTCQVRYCRPDRVRADTPVRGMPSVALQNYPLGPLDTSRVIRVRGWV